MKLVQMVFARIGLRLVWPPRKEYMRSLEIIVGMNLSFLYVFVREYEQCRIPPGLYFIIAAQFFSLLLALVFTGSSYVRRIEKREIGNGKTAH